jgi:hypothetical protein
MRFCTSRPPVVHIERYTEVLHTRAPLPDIWADLCRGSLHQPRRKEALGFNIYLRLASKYRYIDIYSYSISVKCPLKDVNYTI